MARFKSLPTDPQKLQELYDKLKDKEAKLEADLAMRECPECQELLIKLTLAQVDVKKRQDNLYKEKSNCNSENAKAKAIVLKRLENNLERLKASITPDEDAYIKSLFALEHSKQQYTDIYAQTEQEFQKHGIDLISLIPTLKKFLNE